MFIDEAEIYVRAGDGGPGCVSFRREKFIPKGGPDGGDGGDGGDIVFEVDAQMNTLLGFAGKHHWVAPNGMPGEGANRTGRSGEHLVVRVPPGTLIFDRDSRLQLKDLTRARQRVRLLRGGRGGLGNRRFATPTRQTPRQATPGQVGEERWLRLELRLIADVGLVGLPNAGKSTLLARTTKARPKIADYPFTTLAPQLGIVELAGYRQYVMADIPGLIAGASEGVGLGHAFLRHIERTRLIVHLIDLMPLDEQCAPADAYTIVRAELARHSTSLANKPELVVGTKTDLTDSDRSLAHLRQELGRDVLAISSVTGRGIEEFHERVWAQLNLDTAEAGESPARDASLR